MVGYRALAAEAALPWRQTTLLASVQSILGRSAADPLVLGTWLAVSVPLFGSTVLAWHRHGSRAEMFPRLLGVGLLAILVTNPYAYFYDAVLALPAALVVWLRPGAFRDRRLHSGSRVATGALWVWMHLQFFVLMGEAKSLAGVGLAIWLCLELADLRPWRRSEPA
jgi:hypothetical protein